MTFNGIPGNLQVRLVIAPFLNLHQSPVIFVLQFSDTADCYHWTMILVKFAFPRTGSHFLTYALAGLYDVKEVAGVPVAVTPQVNEAIAPRVSEEVLTRYNELNPSAIYALSLRERDAGPAPLLLMTERNGVHGTPGDLLDNETAVLLIRDPLATLFSYFRVLRDRWAPESAFDADSVRINLAAYSEFYDVGWALKQERPSQVALLRYEQLVASSEALRYLATFLNYRPKLTPEFVWEITRFQNIVASGERTFYREGNNEAWKRNPYFVECVRGAGEFDFTRFGYGSRESYLEGM